MKSEGLKVTFLLSAIGYDRMALRKAERLVSPRSQSEDWECIHSAAQWELTLEEVNRLNQVSATAPIYPYWHQRKFGAERIPQ